MTALRLVGFVLLCSWLPSASAIELFRGDTRPPSEIFNIGFAGIGTNADPLAHIAGTSCFNPHAPASQRTAYVATTLSSADAMYYGDYIYRITPDANAGEDTATFDAPAALAHIDENPDQYRLPLRQQATAHRLRTFHSTQGQHIARRIPPEWIQSADVYEYDMATASSRFVMRVFNPDYRAPANSGSRTRFSAPMVAAMGGDPPEIFVTAAAPNGTSVSACMATTGSCGRNAPQSILRQSQRPPLACQSEQALLPGDPYYQVLDIILD